MEVKSNKSSTRGRINGEWSVSPILFAVLTLNFILQVYRSLDEPLAIAFLAFSYSDLALLFWCVHKFEQEEENTARKERLKMAICVLPAILITMFTYRVAAIMPPAVKVLLWSMAGLSVCGAILCACLRGKTSDIEGKVHKMEAREFESRKNAAYDNV